VAGPQALCLEGADQPELLAVPGEVGGERPGRLDVIAEQPGRVRGLLLDDQCFT
jgi:hypothetical protein